VASPRSAVSSIAAAKVVQAIATVAVTFLVARGVGSAGQGLIEDATIWPLLLVPLTSFSLSHGAVTTLRRGVDQSTVVSAVVTLAGITMALSVAAGVATVAISPPELGASTGLLAFGLLPAIWLTTIATSITWTSGNSTASSFVEAAQSTVRMVVLAGIFVAGVMTPRWVVVVLIGSWAVVAVLYLAWTLQQTSVILTRVNLWSTIRALVEVTLPTTINVFLLAGLLRLDVLLLFAFDVEKSEIGQYAVALKVGELLWFIPLARGQAFIVESAKRHSPGFAVQTSDVALTLVAGVFMVGALAIGSGILGDDYGDVATFFAFLLVGVVAYSALPTARNLLIVSDKAWLLAGIMLGGLFVNAVGNVLLIPAMGVPGAAIASSVSYTLVSLAVVGSARMVGSLPAV